MTQQLPHLQKGPGKKQSRRGVGSNIWIYCPECDKLRHHTDSICDDCGNYRTVIM